MANEEQPRDHVPPEAEPVGREMSDIESNVKSRSTWVRLAFMIVVLVLYAISRVIVLAVVALQFLWVLFSGKTNSQLAELGQSLATYTYQIIRYLSFVTGDRPFPFDLGWPSGSVSDESDS